MGKNHAKKKNKNKKKTASNVLASETLARCFEIFTRNLQRKGSRADGNIFWIYFNAYSCTSRRLGAVYCETGSDPCGDTFFGQAHKELSGSFDFRCTKISPNCGRSSWRFERLWAACHCWLSLKPVVFFHLEGSVSNWFNHPVTEPIANLYHINSVKRHSRVEAADFEKNSKQRGSSKRNNWNMLGVLWLLW